MNHPFESTLGAGPYRFVGSFSIIKPCENMPEGNYSQIAKTLHKNFVRGSGTCAHCGMAIMNVFQVETGNGEVYGVGCDCIMKVGMDAAELTKVEKAVKQHEKQLRLARKETKAAAAKAKLNDLLDNRAEELKKLPHPCMRDKTLYDYAGWCRDNARNPVYCLANVERELEK